MNEKLMKALAELTELNFDGGNGEDRLHYDEERINVYAHLMSKKEYSKMETKIRNSTIKGKGYNVYAWNDSSSYEFWKNGGESGDSNYIQITATITDLNKVDPDKLKLDVIKMYNKLSHYDNAEEYFSNKVG